MIQTPLSSRLIGVLAMFAAFTLASCVSEDPDGKWDPMKWKADVPIQIIDGVYTVHAVGEELTFTCQNYSSPWIEFAASGEEYFFHSYETNDHHTLSTDWFKAETSGNKLKVSFEANETAKERPLELTVTAGDIFYTFKFMQLAN